ncbi:MAG: hypothetical protein ABSC94_12900 [Polyangiaceae bacterium]|jgi:modulator of FtsH protease
MSSPTAGWENFFVAQVGAAAALSGLVFVAVSISLRAILASQHLRDRATETLMTFMSVLAIATCGLVPGQGTRALGAEVVAFSGFVWLIATRRHLRAYRDPGLDVEARRWLWARVLGAQAGGLAFLLAGGLLLTGHEAGLAWVAPGVLASFAAGAFNAWVLLVEIQH